MRVICKATRRPVLTPVAAVIAASFPVVLPVIAAGLAVILPVIAPVPSILAPVLNPADQTRPVTPVPEQRHLNPPPLQL